MKRFIFKLEKVMQWRKFKEDECRIELGQAVSNLNMIENEIKTTAVKRLNAVSRRFNDINEIEAWNNYILRLDQQAERLMERAAQAEIIVEEKRVLYLEASKEFKTIEKLKEKQEKEHRKEMMNSQMAEIDDLIAARHEADIYNI